MHNNNIASLDSNGAKDIWTLIVIGVVIGSVVIGAGVYAILYSYSTTSDVKRSENLQRAVDATRLVENFRWQCEILTHVPRPWGSWSSFKPYVVENIVSILAIATLAISVSLLLAGFLMDTWSLARDDLLSAGIISFTVSCCVFVIFRQWIYYREKQRVGGAAAVDAGFIPDSTVGSSENLVSLAGGAPGPRDPLLIGGGAMSTGRGGGAGTTTFASSSRGAGGVVGSGIRPLPGHGRLTIRTSTSTTTLQMGTASARLKEYAANTMGGTGLAPRSLNLSTQTFDVPTFYTFDWNWRNVLQILIVVVEFVQLISFPLRDFFNNPLFQGSSLSTSARIVNVLDNVVRVLTLIPDQLSEQILFEFEFWSFFAIISSGAALAIAFSIAKYKYNREVGMGWVFALSPLASILYLPILVTFVSSSACITQKYKSQALRCSNQAGNEALYFLFSVLGFLMSYILLTLFLSSDERRPTEGDITFKSSSVAFMKNMGFLLVIISLLIPSNKAVVRGLMSLFVVTIMCAFNIRQRPCYVYSINSLRTGTLSVILWTTLVVTLLNDQEILEQVGLTTVWLSFAFGWAAIMVGFLLVFRMHMDMRSLKLQALLPAVQDSGDATRPPPTVPYYSGASSSVPAAGADVSVHQQQQQPPVTPGSPRLGNSRPGDGTTVVVSPVSANTTTVQQRQQQQHHQGVGI